MTLGVMQPYFFPYIGYFQLISAVDVFVIYDDVNYIKQGWINRNRILVNGQPHYITLELVASSSFKKINELTIGKNKGKILKTITACYKKAPYFAEAYRVVESSLNSETPDLAAFLTHSLKEINAYLEINTKVLMSSELKKNNELKGQEKILHICHLLNANTYVNAAGGKELYSKEVFKAGNVDLKFIQTNSISYNQSSDSFHPHLSIIDVLMNNDKSKVKEMLGNYVLT